MSDFMAPEQDVVVFSRVRLARNFADTPFIPSMDAGLAEKNVERVKSYVSQAGQSDRFDFYRLGELSSPERMSLVERRLISYDAIKRSDWAAALVSKDESVTIMVNEEDHVRVQGKLAGLQLEKAGELAFQTEDTLSTRGEMAFDTQWGYLTSRPTNAGTGMRAAAILHLPALMATGQLNQITQAIARLGMSMRGMYAEGCDAMCAMYIMCNQSTLGRTEDDILRSLTAATLQVAGHERAVRENMSATDMTGVSDKLMRSVGILKYAKIMEFGEFMTRISDLRMAAAMNLIDISLETVDRLIVEMQPACLEVALGGKDKRGQDIERQVRVSSALGGL